MKKIGRGWQYTTYDLGNGRVLKKYNSKIVGYVHMFFECFPFINDPIWKLPGYYRGCKKTASDSLIKVSTTPVEMWMMGNPKIINGLDYEQDKLLPLHDFFESCSIEDGKKIIDAFIEFNTFLIEKRLIDKSFNITKNFALDDKGRVVLMDLGELYSSEQSINKQINKKAWMAHYVIKHLPDSLSEYFIENMNQALGAIKI
jgi:hypothetical protein